jgi:cellulose biosynthesis protein BcsQ
LTRAPRRAGPLIEPLESEGRDPVTDVDDGMITTFYSFKGGVGRSMALANVAFMAAMNNYSVLVMDWDLEAPGLAYYFRGLLDSTDWRALKKTPGILDAAWDWVTTVRETKDGRELNDYIGRYINGYAFDEMIRPLLDDQMQSDGFTLDILGAGSDTIGGKLSYEEALSVFSWPDFFAKDAGGVLLEALRNWAKDRYDIILIDSRTGLADVAGICTMQLPDTVALCFILNRQNMEGVARVAGAIRAKRAEEVKLRVVPMRLASRGTSEEASAQSRARRELTMHGGFSGDTVDDDVRLLGVAASPNVPFYEAIAPIMAIDPRTDALSLNYLGLASNLLGLELVMPDLPDAWTERVRGRLKPSHATPDYLIQLRASDPERAFSEVSRLVEHALDAQLEHDSELEDDYVEALVRTTFTLGDDADSPFDMALLLRQVADLVRARMVEMGADWHPLLVETMANLVEYAAYLEDGEELAIVDELDALLAADQTIQGRLTRLRHRRRAARLHIVNDDYEAAFQAIAEIVQLIDSLQHNELSPEQKISVQSAEADSFLLRGDAYAPSAPERAVQEYRRGHALPAVRERSELLRLRFEFSTRLAIRFPELVDREQRARYALEAAQAGAGQTYGIFLFVELAEPLLEYGPERGPRVQRFVEAMFGHGRLRNFGTFHGRQPRTAARFLDTATHIVEVLGETRPPGWEKATEDIARGSEQVSKLMIARRATVSTRSPEHPFADALTRLVGTLHNSGAHESARELEASLAMIESRTRRPRPGGNTEPGGTG